jgi:hypothetical protein
MGSQQPNADRAALTVTRANRDWLRRWKIVLARRFDQFEIYIKVSERVFSLQCPQGRGRELPLEKLQNLDRLQDRLQRCNRKTSNTRYLFERIGRGERI